jgi:hypothetical protein
MMNEERRETRLTTPDVVSAADTAGQHNLRNIEEGAPKPAPVPVTVEKRETQPSALLASGQAETFRSRWMNIQIGFVDEPRSSVEQADSLVDEVMRHITETFTQERAQLEEQWSRGDDISTEDLRLTLQRYRTFFDRLLSL